MKRCSLRAGLPQAIQEQSGATIAQDEGTCSDFAKPKAAVDAGAADSAVPLRGIAHTIVELLRQAYRKKNREETGT